MYGITCTSTDYSWTMSGIKLTNTQHDYHLSLRQATLEDK